MSATIEASPVPPVVSPSSSSPPPVPPKPVPSPNSPVENANRSTGGSMDVDNANLVSMLNKAVELGPAPSSMATSMVKKLDVTTATPVVVKSSSSSSPLPYKVGTTEMKATPKNTATPFAVLSSSTLGLVANGANNGNGKTVRKRSWRKPKDKPKRPLSAYNLFFQQERERIIGSKAAAASSNSKPRRRREKHGKIGFAELARNISEKWKVLDKSSRVIYEARAELEKIRYKRELEAWQKQRVEKEKMEREQAAAAQQAAAAAAAAAQQQAAATPLPVTSSPSAAATPSLVLTPATASNPTSAMAPKSTVAAIPNVVLSSAAAPSGHIAKTAAPTATPQVISTSATTSVIASAPAKPAKPAVVATFTCKPMVLPPIKTKVIKTTITPATRPNKPPAAVPAFVPSIATTTTISQLATEGVPAAPKITDSKKEELPAVQVTVKKEDDCQSRENGDDCTPEQKLWNPVKENVDAARVSATSSPVPSAMIESACPPSSASSSSSSLAPLNGCHDQQEVAMLDTIDMSLDFLDPETVTSSRSPSPSPPLSHTALHLLGENETEGDINDIGDCDSHHDDEQDAIVIGMDISEETTNIVRDLYQKFEQDPEDEPAIVVNAQSAPFASAVPATMEDLDFLCCLDL